MTKNDRWESTVLPVLPIDLMVLAEEIGKFEVLLKWILEHKLQQQAKVSFEAGKQEGRQEIINWVRSHFGIWNHGAEFLYLIKSLGYELTPKETELINGFSLNGVKHENSGL